MSALEKEKVVKQYKTFLANGFKMGNFTKAIYNYLHVHCGFIAHYNINGFYSEYFEDPQDIIRFLEELINYPYPCHEDYRDINPVIIELSKSYLVEKKNILIQLKQENVKSQIQDLANKYEIDLNEIGR